MIGACQVKRQESEPHCARSLIFTCGSGFSTCSVSASYRLVIIIGSFCYLLNELVSNTLIRYTAILNALYLVWRDCSSSSVYYVHNLYACSRVDVGDSSQQLRLSNGLSVFQDLLTVESWNCRQMIHKEGSTIQ